MSKKHNWNSKLKQKKLQKKNVLNQNIQNAERFNVMKTSTVFCKICIIFLHYQNQLLIICFNINWL